MRFDAVIMGGGLAGMTVGTGLQSRGINCVVVAGGLSLYDVPREEFIDLGGTLLAGDVVTGGKWNGMRLECVYTLNLEDTALEAENFVLATGKFFSRGLVSTMDGIYEPVFGCDVICDTAREKWVNPDFFGPQPFESYGVKTDAGGLVFIKGRPAENLYAAGEILAGKVNIVESALEVCRRII